MSLWLPLLLVALGAGLHALWNALVKRSGASDPVFVWAYSALAAPAWATLLIWWLAARRPLGQEWWAAIVSMALHTAYAVVLQRGYSAADLAVIYPVSRGLAPVLVTVAATPWAGAPTPVQQVALPVVLVGVFLASGVTARGLMRSSGLGLAVAVAVCTSAYTLWDAFAVARLHVSVGPYLAVSSLSQLGLLTIVLAHRGRELQTALVAGWRLAAPIAVLAPCSYALVLAAMQLGPPSMVATARSMNIVFGALVGAWLLHERTSLRALLGIAVITLGAALSAL